MTEHLLSKKKKFWLCVGVFISGLIFFFSYVMMPFFIGFIIAYLLKPMVDFLEKKNIRRIVGTNIVILTFIIAISLFGYLFIPIVSQELSGLFTNIPQYLKKVIAFLNTEYGDMVALFNIQDIQEEVRQYIGTIAKGAAGATQHILGYVVKSSISIISIIASSIVALVAAFYIILDWDKMIQTVEGWLPLQHKETIKGLFQKINHLQASFIRGQSMVCLIMALYYITVFLCLDIKYAFTLGLMTGILTFIPYVGAVIGFIITIIIALAHFLPDYSIIWILASFFIFGQTVEGYFLIPLLVGGAVSLHPAWIMFALMAFGSLFGISGMLIAVPVTVFIGVFLEFMLKCYKKSDYYNT